MGELDELIRQSRLSLNRHELLCFLKDMTWSEYFEWAEVGH